MPLRLRRGPASASPISGRYAGAGSPHRGRARRRRTPRRPRGRRQTSPVAVVVGEGRASRRRRRSAGRTLLTHSSTCGSWSRGTKSPHSRICGITTAGMNCTAWNSVCAKALTKRPSAVPRTASTTATTSSSQTGPWTSRPSRPTLRPTASAAWTRGDRAERHGVADQEVELAHRHREQPLEGAAAALAQRGHAGHQEHHDEREHRQQRRSDLVEDRGVLEHPPQQGDQQAGQHQQQGERAVVAAELGEHPAGDGAG